MEELKCSTVHRKLDARLKIIGFEVMDLLAVLMIAAVSNLFLGRMKFAPVFVLLVPSILAAILYFAKRNKPEGFLIHWIKYFTSPGIYSAGQANPKKESERKKAIVKV